MAGADREVFVDQSVAVVVDVVAQVLGHVRVNVRVPVVAIETCDEVVAV